MESNTANARLLEIDKELESLPVGYISRKTIRGKVRLYHQWTENGKTKSRYLKAGEAEPLEAQIERRKQLVAEKKSLQTPLFHASERTSRYDRTPVTSRINAFATEISSLTGDRLRSFVSGSIEHGTRDVYAALVQFLNNPSTERVCLIYGLRRTGKTTLIRQAIAQMDPDQFDKTAYLKISRRDTMKSLNQDLALLQEQGFRYVFLDEVTLLPDFIDSAALFSDLFASTGMKLVLTGADSLSFWFASKEELYDRSILLHTTRISFRESSSLLQTQSLEEYLKYGGTCRTNPYGSEPATFTDAESTMNYIDTAICRNLAVSLTTWENGSHLRHLASLAKKDTLRDAVLRVIEDCNYRFVWNLVSQDYPLLAKGLKRRMDLRHKESYALGLTQEHILAIRNYLKIMDVFAYDESEDNAPLDHITITQPGLRFSQTSSIIHSLMRDDSVAALSQKSKQQMEEELIQRVLDQMTKDLLLLETSMTMGARYYVFRLKFARGSYDMVVYDREQNVCSLYLITSSQNHLEELSRMLTDPEKNRMIEQKFGKITSRTILYRGMTVTLGNGIESCRIEDYLEARMAMEMLMY